MKKFIAFITMISCVCVAASAFAYSCSKGKSVTYRTDFHIQTDRGENLPGSFVYYYPRTSFKHSGESFGRAGNDGVAMAPVQVCVPNGKTRPKFINANIVIKDPWDGGTYKIKQMRIRMYKEAGWDTAVEPVILSEL